MSSIKLIVGAIALATAMICVSYAETTVTLPDVNAKIYGKLNYMAYYNEDTSGNGVWKSGNNASRIGLTIEEAADINPHNRVSILARREVAKKRPIASFSYHCHLRMIATEKRFASLSLATT